MDERDERWTDEQLLLTAEEAARMLAIGRTTLYALLKDGQLRAVHIGRSCRLSRAELERYVTRLNARPITQPSSTRKASARRAQRTSKDAQAGLFELEPTSPDAA